MNYRYKQGDRIANIINGKRGYIDELIADEHERLTNWYIEYYHYSVNYDDGTSDPCEPEFNLISIHDGQED